MSRPRKVAIPSECSGCGTFHIDRNTDWVIFESKLYWLCSTCQKRGVGFIKEDNVVQVVRKCPYCSHPIQPDSFTCYDHRGDARADRYTRQHHPGRRMED